MKKYMVFLLVIGVTLTVVAVSGNTQEQKDAKRPTTKSPNGITRTELERHEIPGTDQETRLYLITYPPGIAAPVHHHPVVGLGYVLQGTVESAFGKGPVKTYHQGESFQDEALLPHRVSRNADKKTPLKLLIYYTLKKGEAAVETP